MHLSYKWRLKKNYIYLTLRFSRNFRFKNFSKNTPKIPQNNQCLHIKVKKATRFSFLKNKYTFKLYEFTTMFNFINKSKTGEFRFKKRLRNISSKIFCVYRKTEKDIRFCSMWLIVLTISYFLYEKKQLQKALANHS